MSNLLSIPGPASLITLRFQGEQMLLPAALPYPCLPFFLSLSHHPLSLDCFGSPPLWTLVRASHRPFRNLDRKSCATALPCSERWRSVAIALELFRSSCETVCAGSHLPYSGIQSLGAGLSCSAFVCTGLCTLTSFLDSVLGCWLACFNGACKEISPLCFKLI